MKNNQLPFWSRLVLVLCSLALVAVLFFPLWQIQLSAPQYPEGLVLLIYPHKLGGNVDIINGLNHYIGMKTLHATDFVEFTVLPYIIGFFALILLVSALLGKRKWLNLSFILFLLFGVVAMIDFWKWEYNYGHNLNPDAAIIVPGMAYQPPLIGFKQLLNFGAYSIPDIGGWLFVGVGALLLLLVVMAWRSARQRPLSGAGQAAAYVTLLAITLLSSCNQGPEAIIVGRDHCSFCKMTVSDQRYGAEIITRKGKVYKFDDGHCLLSFLKAGSIAPQELGAVYFTDFANGHGLVKAAEAHYLKSESLRSPMGGNVAAFRQGDSLQLVKEEFPGNTLNWNDLYKP